MRIVLLLCISFNIYAMSFQHVQQVYARIAQANGFSVPPLRLENNSDVNAHAGWGAIYINSGMLRAVHNDDELALVLGHELGHYKLHHWRSTPSNEYAADAQGAYYMSNAGYRICKGAQLIRRFRAPDSDTHPASEKRYHKLGC